MTELSEHPPSEELAAYAAGDLEGAIGVHAHVAACAACGADVAALRQIRAQLGGLPTLQMPLDVVTAVESALSAERATAGESAPTSLAAERRRRSARLAPLAAAAAVVGLAVAVGGGILRGPGEPASTAGRVTSADSAAPAGPRVLRTGTAYSPDQLDAQVRDVLAAPESQALTADAEAMAPAAGDAPADARAAEGTAFSGTAGSAAPPMLTDAALQSCIDELAGQPGAVPLLVDLATYAGAPAIVVVLPFREDRVDVFVVRPDCRVGNDALIIFKRVAGA